MKTQLQLIVFFLCISLTGYAQELQKDFINYQGVASDASGDAIINTAIAIQIALKFGSATASANYIENHSVTTDDTGVFSLQIGNGTVVSGTYNAADWGTDASYITVSLNGTEVGTTEMVAVPYALHATTATTALNAGATSIDGLSDGKSDADGSSLFLGLGAGTNDDGSDNINVGVGYQALTSNTTGFLNTAIGGLALTSNTTGFLNTAIGGSALTSNTTGEENTANGASALSSNTTGSYNTANGVLVLNSNTTGEFNTANGYSALSDNTTGDSNTANGSYSLHNNTTGEENTAIGGNALYSNTTGSYNTANGRLALVDNTTGDYNTANGFETLYLNTTGFENTANGSSALYKNTTGIGNVANGYQALYSNTTGDYNTANGHKALYLNTTGTRNVALGQEAGYSETGSNKLYISNSSTNKPLIYGEFNTRKLEINGATKSTSSVFVNADIVLGGSANTTTGDDGIISSDPDYAGSDIFIRSNDAVVVQLDFDNNEAGQFEIKDGNQVEVFEVDESGNVRVNGNLEHASDRRLKKDIEDLPYGLKEILQLQPKAYNWKDRVTDYKSLGLIAQEVQPIIKEIVNAKDDDLKTLGISYTELIPILINAIKDQQTQIEALQIKNQTQDTALAEVVKRLNTLESTPVGHIKEEINLAVNN